MKNLKKSNAAQTVLLLFAAIVVYAASSPVVRTDAMELPLNTSSTEDPNTGLSTFLRTSFGTAGEFRFITPIAPNPPSMTADFDADLLPYLTVNICKVNATGCSLVKTFTSTSSPDRIRIEFKNGNFFIVNWTTGAGFDNTPVYRISVEVPGETLGSADLPPSAYRQWGRTWPIKFIVEKDPELRIRLLSASGLSLWEIADILRSELGICDDELSGYLISTYPGATAEQVSEVVSGVCQEVVLAPNTKIADAATRNALSFYDLKSGQMLFLGETAILKGLRMNDVLAGKPSPAAPYGYLRKVKGIRKDKGMYILETVQAKLTEAVYQGTLQSSGDLLPSTPPATAKAKGSSLLNQRTLDEGDQLTVDQPIDLTINLEGEDGAVSGTGTVKIVGHVYIKAGYNIGAGIELCPGIPPVCVDRLEAWMGFEQKSNLRIIGDFDGYLQKEKTIYPVPMNPIIFFIGPLPVILVPQMSVIVGVDGEAHIDFEFAAEAESVMKPYLKWTEDEGWRDLSNIDPLARTFFDADISGSIRMEAYAKLDAALLLYGAIGPSMDGSLGIGATAQTGASPLWTIFGHAKVGIGLRSVFTELFDIDNPREALLDETFLIKEADKLPPVFSNVRTGLIPVDVADPVYLGPRTSPTSLQGFYEVRDPDGSTAPNVVATLNGADIGLNPTFTTPGLRTIKITATDSDNISASIFLAIDVRNSIPILTVTPLSGAVHAGDQFFVSARAYDPEDGFLPCGRISWSVDAPNTKQVSSDPKSCKAVFYFANTGMQKISVTAVDSFGATFGQDVWVDVAPSTGNRAPVIEMDSFKIYAQFGPRSADCPIGILCEVPDDSVLYNGQSGDYRPPLRLEISVSDPEGDPFGIVWVCQTGDQFAQITYNEDGSASCEPIYSSVSDRILVYALITTPGGLGSDGYIVIATSPVHQYTMLQRVN